MNNAQREALAAIGALRRIIVENIDPRGVTCVPILRAAAKAEAFLRYQRFWVHLFVIGPKGERATLTHEQYEIISMNQQVDKALNNFVLYCESYDLLKETGYADILKGKT